MTKTRNRRPPIPIGSVSHGTLREEDLIPAFEDFLRRHGSRPPRRPAGIASLLRVGSAAGAHAWESVSWYLNEVLWGRMEALAPPYAYFGASEGDGADFGYWPMVEVALEEVHSGELAGGDEMPDSAPAGSLFLHVSDHGNVELYRRVLGGWESLWSVV